MQGILSAEVTPVRLVGGLILIEVRVGDTGRRSQFLLDTGAEESILSRRVAKELGLKMESTEQVRFPGGLATVPRSSPLRLSAGGVSYVSGGLFCLDLRKESRHLGTRVDGLLGMDFMKNRVVRLDLKRKEVNFCAASHASRTAIVLPMRKHFSALCVSALVGGAERGMVRVDTGSDRTLCWVDARKGTRKGREEVVDLQLGSWVGRGLETLCFSGELFPGEDALLGMGVMGHFGAIVLDSPGGRLVLEQ